MRQVRLTDIQITFDQRFHLNIPDLTIESGTFFGLIGESGSGKTTLLRAIAGLQNLHGGSIVKDDNPIHHLPPEDRGISMVFQEPRLFDHLTVLDNVAFPLRMKGIGRQERTKEAQDLLRLVKLDSLEIAYPASLSGGQKQRVSIARALACKPDLLLMDEPFSALDPELRSDMRSLIKDLHDQLDITIIFVTHHMEEAGYLFSHMALLDKGTIVQVGPPSQMYTRPKSPEIARFMGHRNVFQGKRMETNKQSYFQINEDTDLVLQVPFDTGSIVIPDYTITINEDAPSGDHTQLLAQLVDKQFIHGSLYMTFAYGQLKIHKQVPFEEDSKFKTGQWVSLQVRSDQVLYFKKQ